MRAEREPVDVFAAASLTEVFRALEAPFEAAHPDLDLRLSFAGSQVLRVQLEHGARADVFASANIAHASALEEAGLIATPRPFASNELVAVVAENADAPSSFVELPAAERVVIGTPHAPVGQYARHALDAARDPMGDAFVDTLLSRVASEESNAGLVRAKVLLGEADAAFVYRSDGQHPALRILAFPEPVHATYVIAQTEPTSAGGAAFVAFVESTESQAELRAFGFGTP